MLFNSYPFIFLFLPLVLIVFFLLSSKHQTAARAWVVASSLFFYGWWKAIYLPLLLTSAVCNYLIGTRLSRNTSDQPRTKRALLTLGLVGNIGLLGYFKYANFFISNVGWLTGREYPSISLVLPLAISFFTFQKIAYLVDSYRGETKDYNFLNYLLFVSFFPQLIAGPIVHHREIITQFKDERTYRLQMENLAAGLFIFFVGLFKKVVLADTIAIWANRGFDGGFALNWLQAWTTALAYTLQLYFDFSGYTDMAIGAALLFNIRLPENFNSPYQSTNLKEFWRRWHMTLSRFLRDYVYIPLGGNRGSHLASTGNLLLTFLIGGLWHGAAWTFVFWGFLHGAGMVVHYFWSLRNRPLPPRLGQALTFLFVLLGWIFFRAKHWREALNVLNGMVGRGPALIGDLRFSLKALGDHPAETMEFLNIVLVFAAGLSIVFRGDNTRRRVERLKPSLPSALALAAIIVVSLVHLHRVTEFLYFNF